MSTNKRKFRYDRLFFLIVATAILFFLIYFLIKGISAAFSFIFPDKRNVPDDIKVVENYELLLPSEENSEEVIVETPEYSVTSLDYTDATIAMNDTINSKYGILYCVDTREVIAGKHSKERMYPASMTKIMTLIVAVEHLTDLTVPIQMTFEIINPLYLENATVTGLSSGETVPIIDLLYGIVLPSGADATMAVAQYICGSEEAFVELMNEKAEELGLIDTNFVNTSGLHDENHYTTAYDMGLILDYAIHNDLCRKILSTYKYVTTKTKQHPDGIEFYSTMFNKVASDHIEGMTILGGKTGYTYQSHHCLASFAEKNNRTYIAVTGYGENKYSPIYDMVTMFTEYIY